MWIKCLQSSEKDSMHYENTPIQIYGKFHLQKKKKKKYEIFR